MNFLNFLFLKFNIKLLNLQVKQDVAPALKKLTKCIHLLLILQKNLPLVSFFSETN